MAGHFFSKVSFVNKISDIMQATSDDDRPIPGYLYKQISDITLESSENCESCREFLVDRLNGGSRHVRLKVLKLMKYIVQHGNPDFKLGLIKTSHGIKEATKYSGPPDPLHGNVPFQMVRQVAMELNEILFQSDSRGTVSTEPHSISTVGISNTTSRSSSNPSRPQMEGFGNVTPQTKTVGDSIKDGLRKLADTLGETTLDQQRELLTTLEGSTSSYTPPVDNIPVRVTSPVASASQASPSSHVKPRASPPKHIPGRAGGGWDDSDDDEEDTGRAGSQLPHQSTVSVGSGSQGTPDCLEALTEDVRQEQTVVNGYLYTDERLSPSRLNHFVKDCSCLNCDRVLELINTNIQSAADSTVLNNLLLLEWLMTSDLISLDTLTGICKSGLTHVYSTMTGAPQSKARKLIRILEKLGSSQSILPLLQSPPVSLSTCST